MRRSESGPLRASALLSVLALAAACSDSGGPGAAPAPQLDPQPGEERCAGGEFEGTFDAIQEVIFERRGCTADACHGEARSGGLDLRRGASYANLVEVPSRASSWLRIMPGEPSESFLYQKVAAAAAPGSFEIAGSPMPVGLDPLGEGELEVLRTWIEAGAPETGSVGDSVEGSSDYLAGLLDVCLPPATPIQIAPLAPPAAEEGVQLRMPPYVVPAASEVEVCFAQYYDLSEVVPARFQDAERGVFFVNGSRLRQDPHSHHLVIDHSGLGAESVSHPSFGAWTCRDGPRLGQPCDPLDPLACGEGLCASEVRDSIACIGYGPPEGSVNVAGGGIGGAQTAQQYEPPRDGVYAELPLSGILYWNSHAFNLTDEDLTLHAWQNYFYADDLRFEEVVFIDLSELYAQAGQPPFTIRRYCGTHVVPRGSLLLSLSSHMHKRGRNFTVDLPDGTRIYESFSYSDPVDQRFDPPLRFDQADPAARTLVFCAEFNNGIAEDGGPDPRLVTRRSRMPDRTDCRPVSCVAGRVAEPCANDADCDSAPGAGDGLCDACPITAGPTTENEMFVLTGKRIEPPAGAGG